tara:strand:+ start:25061 stop:25912 length:852 start_codon:yes stop_codon:yes gene_type:complete
MTTLFVPLKIQTNLQLLPQELTNNITQVVYTKLVNKYEGKCNSYGYIKKNSIKILKRNYGEFIKEHFNAALNFKIVFSCIVCNPAQSHHLYCKVIATNNMGIKAVYEVDDDVIIEALVPRLTAGMVSDINLDNIVEGDNITVEIYGKRFNLNDTKIEVIGKAIENINLQNLQDDSNTKDIDDDDDKPLDLVIDDSQIDDENDNNEDDEDEEDDENEEDEEDDITKIKEFKDEFKDETKVVDKEKEDDEDEEDDLDDIDSIDENDGLDGLEEEEDREDEDDEDE